MKRRRPTIRIVRRIDALGRTYFVERKSGMRASRRAWTLDRERRVEDLPREPKAVKPPKRPERRPVQPKEPPFPPGVEAPGVPEEIDPDEIDWSKEAVEGRRDYQ